MIAPHHELDADHYFVALRLCAFYLEENRDARQQITKLNKRFNTQTIDETLAIARTLLFPPDDPTAAVKKAQLQHDIKILTYFANNNKFFNSLVYHPVVQNTLDNTQKYFSDTFQALISTRSRSKSDPSQDRELNKSPSIHVYFESCLEVIAFLYDFAPGKMYEFQSEFQRLKMSMGKSDSHESIRRLHHDVYIEMETHFEEILEALKFRLGNIDFYLKEGCFNKLVQFKHQLDFLIKIILKDTLCTNSFIKPVIEVFEGRKIKISEVSKTKALTLLMAQESNLEKILKERHLDKIKSDYKKIAEFIRNINPESLNDTISDPERLVTIDQAEALYSQIKSIFLDLILDRLKLQLDFIQDDESKEFHLCESWQPLLLKNQEVFFEAMEFAEKFLDEEEHAKKINLFHLYLQKWLEIYPPVKNVDSYALILFTEAMLLQAKCPDLFLELALLEADTIAMMPTTPDHSCAKDYMPEEYSSGSGIRCFHHLNLINALMDICRKPSRVEEEIKLIAARGKKLIEMYAEIGATDLVEFYVEPHKFDDIIHDTAMAFERKKSLLLRLYENSRRCVEQAFWNKMLDFHLMINHRQMDSKDFQKKFSLLNNAEFLKNAKIWAAGFCEENNAINKMNEHHLIVKYLQDQYLIDDLKDMPENEFLLALVIAGDDPRLITEITFLDSQSLGWHVCDPPSGEQRLEDYKKLKAVMASITRSLNKE